MITFNIFLINISAKYINDKLLLFGITAQQFSCLLNKWFQALQNKLVFW